MKKQVVVIHGGDTFPTYEAYLSFLKQKELDFEKLKLKSWKEALAEQLGGEYEVIYPSMPSSTNAKYVEWKIWFEKLIPFLQEEIALVGNSLGGIFVAKYLAENEVPKKIRATFLIAAPYYDVGTEYTLEDFALSGSLKKLHEQGGKIFLYHSEDDPVVPFGNLAKYKAELPDATERVFQGQGHFSQQGQIPTLAGDIKVLYEHA